MPHAPSPFCLSAVEGHARRGQVPFDDAQAERRGSDADGRRSVITETIDPLIRRADGAQSRRRFTDTGTQTHIVGHGAVAVIDPGPDIAVASRRRSSPRPPASGSPRSCARTRTATTTPLGCPPRGTRPAHPMVGCAPILVRERGGLDAGFDHMLRPRSRCIGRRGQSHRGGRRLDARARSRRRGTSSNHLCFALPEADALFSAAITSWAGRPASSCPPDGDMGDYHRAAWRSCSTTTSRPIIPAHGDPVDQPARGWCAA